MSNLLKFYRKPQLGSIYWRIKGDFKLSNALILIRNHVLLILVLSLSLAVSLVFNHNLECDFIHINPQKVTKTVVGQSGVLGRHVQVGQTVFRVFYSPTIGIRVLVIVNGRRDWPVNDNCLVARILWFSLDIPWLSSFAVWTFFNGVLVVEIEARLRNS